MLIELTDEEFKLLSEIFNEHGSDCPYVDHVKMRALAEKLKIWEPIPPPTKEQLDNIEKFKNNPLLIKQIIKDWF